METIIGLILFFNAVILHELGHYWLMVVYEMKPKIRFSWKSLGRINVDRTGYLLTTIKKELNIRLFGIFLPLPLLIFHANIVTFTSYLIVCSFDIYAICLMIFLEATRFRIYPFGEEEFIWI